MAQNPGRIEGVRPPPSQSSATSPESASQSSPNNSLQARAAAAAYAATPGIHLETYYSPNAYEIESGGYFSQKPGTVRGRSSAQAQSPGPTSTTKSTSGADLLKRMTIAAMGRRESLSDIRSANPDLTLSGNIISATFNMPHSFNYRKGSDWVGLDPEKPLQTPGAGASLPA